MKKFFKGAILNRYLVYPVIFMVVWTYVYKNFPDFFLMKITIDNIKTSWIDTLHLDISLKTYVTIFGFLFGYVYGTISLFIKVKEFRGITMFVLFFIKSVISMFITCLFGFIYIIELVLFPLIYLAITRHKRKKKRVEQKDLYKEIERIITNK